VRQAWASLPAGAWTITALTDCVPPVAAIAYSFPTAPVESRPDLAAHWLAEGEFRTRFGCWLLDKPGRRVLVDGGIGPGPVAYFPGLAGRLDAALGEVSVGLADIDLLIFTHLHVDHIGWARHLPNAGLAIALLLVTMSGHRKAVQLPRKTKMANADNAGARTAPVSCPPFYG
jgi:glyoxylase-like metal-dependent hydrolase (beta-lactamase superfamily II)